MKNEIIDIEIVEKRGIVLAPFTDLTLVEGVDLDKLLEEYAEVPTIDPESENAGEEYQYVLKGHKAFVKARVKIEKVRKILKAPALEYNREVEAKSNELKAKIHDKEIALFTQRKLVEDNEQRNQDELIAKERDRVELIDTNITKLKMIPLENMGKNSVELTKVYENIVIPSEDMFEERLEEAVITYKDTMQKLEQAIETATKAEQAEQIQAEQEAKRAEEEVQREAAQKKEREAFEAEKAEFAKQKEEQERFARDHQEDINRQNAEREAEEFADKQDKERIENQKQEEAHRETMIAETLEAMSKCESQPFLLSEIMSGAIPHLKFGA